MNQQLQLYVMAFRKLWSVEPALRYCIIGGPVMICMLMLVMCLVSLNGEYHAHGTGRVIKLENRGKNGVYAILENNEDVFISLIPVDEGDMLEKKRGEFFYIVNQEKITDVPQLIGRIGAFGAVTVILFSLAFIATFPLSSREMLKRHAIKL